MIHLIVSRSHCNALSHMCYFIFKALSVVCRDPVIWDRRRSLHAFALQCCWTLCILRPHQLCSSIASTIWIRGCDLRVLNLSFSLLLSICATKWNDGDDMRCIWCVLCVLALFVCTILNVYVSCVRKLNKKDIHTHTHKKQWRRRKAQKRQQKEEFAWVFSLQCKKCLRLFFSFLYFTDLKITKCYKLNA